MSPALLKVNTGNRAHSMKDRGHDEYFTPHVATVALHHFEGGLVQPLWECASGVGNIVRPLKALGYQNIAKSDIQNHGLPGSKQMDFLASKKMLRNSVAVITNPPFHSQLPVRFVLHAMEMCNTVYLFARVGFLAGCRWEAKGLADHLSHTLIFAPRLPMMHREGWTGKKTESSQMDFAWFVFKRFCRQRLGPPCVHWIDWRETVVDYDHILTSGGVLK